MKEALKKQNLVFDVQVVQGRIVVYLDDVDRGIEVLSHVFGVTSLSPAYEIPTDVSIINTTTYEVMNRLVTTKESFALRVSRMGTHDFSSQDIAISLGSFIQEKTGLSVDLSHPDIEIFIEIREDHSFIFLEKIAGPGGMPLGSQGKMITILNSPYDLLASWYLLKRGCEMIYLYNDKAMASTFNSFFSRWHVPKNMQYVQKDKGFWEMISMLIKKNNCLALCSGIFFSDKINEPLSVISSLEQKISVPVLTPLISYQEEAIRKLCREKGITS